MSARSACCRFADRTNGQVNLRDRVLKREEAPIAESASLRRVLQNRRHALAAGVFFDGAIPHRNQCRRD